MAYSIHIRVDQKRGCGYRKGGGLYFVSGGRSKPCGKLPIEVGLCPCCGQGIQQHRGIEWVTSELIDAATCSQAECAGKQCFPFCVVKRYAMMWVGEKFYKTPDHFEQEVAQMGISKRLPFVPKGFVVGTDWVLLAHPKTPFFDAAGNCELKKAIFMAFCPQAIEYVVKGTETPEELQALADQGITLVQVVKAEEKAKQEGDSLSINFN